MGGGLCIKAVTRYAVLYDVMKSFNFAIAKYIRNFIFLSITTFVFIGPERVCRLSILYILC